MFNFANVYIFKNHSMPPKYYAVPGGHSSAGTDIFENPGAVEGGIRNSLELASLITSSFSLPKPSVKVRDRRLPIETGDWALGEDDGGDIVRMRGLAARIVTVFFLIRTPCEGVEGLRSLASVFLRFRSALSRMISSRSSFCISWWPTTISL